MLRGRGGGEDGYLKVDDDSTNMLFAMSGLWFVQIRNLGGTDQ